MEQSTFRIFSFYNSKVNARVPEYQQAVFKKLGFTIEHIVDENYSHGDFLNYICRNITDTRFIIVFDIDCIPVNKKWIVKLLADLQQPHTIAGAAQTANHLQEGKNLYVSPFFFGISTAYLKELNYPDMTMTTDMDAGQNLTGEVIKNGGIVNYWFPTHIEAEEWDLYHPVHKRFGAGTTYNDAVYHAFFSRFDQSDRFVKKCKAVLNFFGKLRYIKLPRAYRKVAGFLGLGKKTPHPSFKTPSQ